MITASIQISRNKKAPKIELGKIYHRIEHKAQGKEIIIVIPLEIRGNKFSAMCLYSPFNTYWIGQRLINLTQEKDNPWELFEGKIVLSNCE